MDPMSLIGAGTSLVGGIMGAQAADQANQQNWTINQLNFMLSNQERMDQIKARYAQAQERTKEQTQQQQGSTDVQGNHTHYVPGRGWVTDLSEQGQHRLDQANTMNDAAFSEKMKELNHDLPLQRYQEDRNFDQTNAAADQAGIFQKMLHSAMVAGPDKYDQDGSQLYAQSAKAINDGYNGVQQDATRSAVRQGTSADGALASLARARTQDLQQASMASQLQGRKQSQADYGAKIANLTNLMNAFTGNSRGGVGGLGFDAGPTDYNANSIAQTSPQVAANASLQMNDGYQQIGDAYAKQGGRVDYVQPNYGEANTIASFGNTLAGMGKKGGGSSVGGSSGASTGGGGGFGSLMSAFMPNIGAF